MAITLHVGEGGGLKRKKTTGEEKAQTKTVAVKG
jgi:hypothetical protein